MPMFDYRCKKCGNVSEYIVKTFDTKGIKCKACGSAGLTKLLSASNVIPNPNNREPPHTYPTKKFYD